MLELLDFDDIVEEEVEEEVDVEVVVGGTDEAAAFTGSGTLLTGAVVLTGLDAEGAGAFVDLTFGTFVAAVLVDESFDASAAFKRCCSADFKPFVPRLRFFNSTRSLATVNFIGSTILDMCGD